VRVSRCCYDKMHRCPGWAGPGLRYPKVDRCVDGRLRRDGVMDDIYTGFWWRWRFNRCDTCDLVVLPYGVRYVDPTWWRYRIRAWFQDIRYRIEGWRLSRRRDRDLNREAS
jgi:hypothetical protein